jgi:hypothetical protein
VDAAVLGLRELPDRGQAGIRVQVLAELLREFLGELLALDLVDERLEAALQIDLVDGQVAGLGDVREVPLQIRNGLFLEDSRAEKEVVGLVRERRVAHGLRVEDRQGQGIPLVFCRLAGALSGSPRLSTRQKDVPVS